MENKEMLPVEAVVPPEEMPQEAEEMPDVQATLAVLERLTPGIAGIMLEALKKDGALAAKVQEGKMDMIDLYKLLEGKDRPAVAPTARFANAPKRRDFNAYDLSDEAFNALQEQVRRGYTIAI